MSQTTFNAIFISDLHLGFGETNTKKLFSFLREVECKKLFLVGDIIHRRCPNKSDELDEFISIVKNKDCETIFIIGNHEQDKKELPIALNNIKIHQKYIYRAIKHTIYVDHGHTYDSKDDLLRALKKVAKKTKIKDTSPPIKIILKRVIYKSMKLTAQIFLHRHFRKHMSLKAKKNRCSAVVCGHFHVANSKICYEINYFNCGDWIKNCSYIAEDFEGNLKLFKY